MANWQKDLGKVAEKMGIKASDAPLSSSKKTKIGGTTHSESAHAPYNFVPLNKQVVPAEAVPSFDKYHIVDENQIKRYSGYIECGLETLTPLYIRDALDQQQVENGARAKDVSRFFSPAEKIRIPGSSLRGMIRTLVEVVSWSKFGSFDDEYLYYRAVADTSSLGDEYRKNMAPLDTSGKGVYQMSAGYLVKDGINYSIKPAQIDDKGKPYKQIKRAEAKNKCKQIVVRYEHFKFYKLKEGYLVVSGPMKGKEHDWIIYHKNENETPIDILPVDIECYRKDKNRKGVDLLDKLNKDQEVPCFYIKWRDSNNRDRVSFGHTGMFRLAYKKSIGEHIPKELKDSEELDIAETIFGKASELAGRVFFEDAVSENAKTKVMKEIRIRLLGPKPTSFQLYLEQPPNADVKSLNHYDTPGAKIRGNKFYWHKSEMIKQKIDKFNPNTDSKIRPIGTGADFTFRIRFENLSQMELGALLFVLNLPEGCAHKLGMGKPLGLGSVRITPKLFISNRAERYQSLFAESEKGLSWNTKDELENNLDSYSKAFGEYILEHLADEEKSGASNLWQTPRLKALSSILNFDQNTKLPGWNDRTNYMKLGPEFNKRLVLPTPEEVTK